MLRIMGSPVSACDGIPRREALRVGGLSLLGLSLADSLRAVTPDIQRTRPSLLRGAGRAKSVILLNLFGGPPHQDMFDLKPEASADVRGEFKPISTSLAGVQICELLPKTALVMDRATLIRTYSHRYNSHNPYNVLTGFDLGQDRENYFAKRTDHPSIGSVCRYFGRTREDVPSYVTMPAFPGYSQALRRAGPYGGYLGSQYDPLMTVCDPVFSRESKDFYDPVEAIGTPRPPALGEQADLTVDRLDGRHDLLEQIDRQRAVLDGTPPARRWDKYKQAALSLLSSSQTRAAFDLSREPDSVRERYGNHLWGTSMLMARRLIEVGAKFVTVHWEATHANHWDLHQNNFGMLRLHLPQLDQLTSAIVLDLEERGLLDETLVVVMGEMGRTPKVNKAAGRDHWPQCGFALLFGGGTRRGCVVGATDRQAAYPTDRPVSAGDLAATIYHLLGIDPHQTVPDLSSRPVEISHGGQVVQEAVVG